MVQQDYLLDLIRRLADAIRRSIDRSHGQHDPHSAALLLEQAIREATDLDGDVFLSLSPESMASILTVSGTDERVGGYIVRSLQLIADYYEEAGETGLAELRAAQAASLGEAYGVQLDSDSLSPEELEEFFEESMIGL